MVHFLWMERQRKFISHQDAGQNVAAVGCARAFVNGFACLPSGNT
jgi:hypothetical protein